MWTPFSLYLLCAHICSPCYPSSHTTELFSRRRWTTGHAIPTCSQTCMECLRTCYASKSFKCCKHNSLPLEPIVLLTPRLLKSSMLSPSHFSLTHPNTPIQLVFPNLSVTLFCLVILSLNVSFSLSSSSLSLSLSLTHTHTNLSILYLSITRTHLQTKSLYPFLYLSLTHLNILSLSFMSIPSLISPQRRGAVLKKCLWFFFPHLFNFEWLPDALSVCLSFCFVSLCLSFSSSAWWWCRCRFCLAPEYF